MKLTPQDLAILAEAEKRVGYKIRRFFPESGPYARSLYPKHLKLFRGGGFHEPMDICPPDCDGSPHRERCFMAANRVGKTLGGAYETTLHLTGEYDTYAPWWVGRRFDGPIRMWAAGDTSKTTRDIIQDALMGPPNDYGSGMLPAHLVVDKAPKQGIADALESVWVKHRTGGKSVVQFKSYDQRREAFQGTSQHVIWLDEECPDDIYAECLLRTARTSDFEGGIILLTFTPLMGMTPLVMSFLPGGVPA